MCEGKVGNRSHVFRIDIVNLTVSVDQIDHDRRRGFALRQFQVGHKDNNPRVSITPQVEQVCYTHDGKRIPKK